MTRPRFEDVVSQFQTMVARICASYERDRELARDLAQDVWFAIWRALPAYRAESSLKTFVARAAQRAHGLGKLLHDGRVGRVGARALPVRLRRCLGGAQGWRPSRGRAGHFAPYAAGVGVYHAFARRRVSRFQAMRMQFALRAEEG